MSTCILCYKNFIVVPPSIDVSINSENKSVPNEEKENFKIFCKSLKISEHDYIFKTFDFKTKSPFCSGCSHFSKELNEHYKSRNELEEQILTWQKLIVEKTRDLSICVDKFDEIFRQVKSLIEISEKTKTKRKTEVQGRKKSRFKVDNKNQGIELKKDENVETLRKLILEEWLPEKTDDAKGEESKKSNEIGSLVNAYPFGFIAPTVTCDSDITIKQELLDFYDEPNVDENDWSPFAVGAASHESEEDNSFEDFSSHTNARTRKESNLKTLGNVEHRKHLQETEDCKRGASKRKDESAQPSSKRFKKEIVKTLNEDQEKAAISFKHRSILGQFEFIDDKIMFNDIELKRFLDNEWCSYTCEPCGMTKVANLTDLSSVRAAGQFLRAHIKAEHLGGFTCEHCIKNGKSFNSDSQEVTLKHLNEAHEESTYECKICGKPFNERPLYVNHQRWGHKNKQEKTEAIESLRKERNPIVKIRKVSKKKKHKCLECDLSFASLSNLKVHVKSHFEEIEKETKRVPCQYCGEMCLSDSIQSHLELVHNKSMLNWHSCPFCDLKFYNETVLSRHIRRSHSVSEEKSQQESFTSVKNLTTYKELHDEDFSDDGEKIDVKSAVEDILASQKSQNKLTRKKQMKVKKSPKQMNTYVCTLCSSCFSKSYRLKRHIKTVHADLIGSQTIFKCTLCDSSFKLKDKLSRHMRTVHKNGRLHKKRAPTNSIPNNATDITGVPE